jgi:peptidoglycan/LPS O-acetylase OafA/YrhL
LSLALTVVITLVLAWLSYRCVEAPSLRWKAVNLLRSRNLSRPLRKGVGPEVALALIPERAD